MSLYEGAIAAGVIEPPSSEFVQAIEDMRHEAMRQIDATGKATLAMPDGRTVTIDYTGNAPIV